MALRDQPYLPLYVMDFMTDEKLAECSAESTGVYIRVMCIMHKMGEYGVISLKAREAQSDDTILNFAQKLVKHLPYSVDVIKRSLAELVEEGVLTIDGNRLIQRRMVRDGEISKARAEAGAKGGSAKKQNENKPEANDGTPAKKSKPSKVQDERFEAFWKEYPKKVGKGAARKAWARITPTEEQYTQILAALQEVKKSEQWRKNNGQFIPHPTTWLNQTRWEDGENPEQTPFDLDSFMNNLGGDNGQSNP